MKGQPVFGKKQVPMYPEHPGESAMDITTGAESQVQKVQMKMQDEENRRRGSE